MDTYEALCAPLDIVSSLFVENSQLEEFAGRPAVPSTLNTSYRKSLPCWNGAVFSGASPLQTRSPNPQQLPTRNMVSKMMCWIEVLRWRTRVLQAPGLPLSRVLQE